MLPRVCTLIKHRWDQNRVRRSVTHFAVLVINYWTDTGQHGIYLLISVLSRTNAIPSLSQLQWVLTNSCDYNVSMIHIPKWLSRLKCHILALNLLKSDEFERLGKVEIKRMRHVAKIIDDHHFASCHQNISNWTILNFLHIWTQLYKGRITLSNG